MLMLTLLITTKPHSSNKITRKGMPGRAKVSLLLEMVSLQGERGQMFASRENSFKEGGVKIWGEMCYLEEVGDGRETLTGKARSHCSLRFPAECQKLQQMQLRWVGGGGKLEGE